MTSSEVPNRTTICRNLCCRKWSGLRVCHAHYARQIPDSIVKFEIVTFEQAIRFDSYDTKFLATHRGVQFDRNPMHYGFLNYDYGFELAPFLLEKAVEHKKLTGKNLLYDSTNTV